MSRSSDAATICDCHLHENQVCDVCQGVTGEERDWTPEEYAWSCADDMRGWAMRSEEACRQLREENFQLRREVADLKGRMRNVEP